MGCFSCLKPSEESKKIWKCWKGKSPKADETLRKRKRRGLCGLCGKRSLKDGDSPRKQGSTCCFFGKTSSKDEKQDLIKKNEGSREGGKRYSSEEPSKREGEGCMSRLLCCKPKKDEMEGGKKKSSACGCFGRAKRSSDESSKRKREGCVSCFCCFKSSKKNKEEELKRDNDKACSCACVKSSEDQSYFSCSKPSSTEAKGCFSCFKSSKKKESRNACKRKCTSASYSCCCSSSANKKAKKPMKKRARLAWRKKEKKKMDQLAPLVKTTSFASDCSKHMTAAEEILRIDNGNIAARVFTYCELVTATQNFASECLLCEGGFGKVYKGHLKDTNQDIAVKLLDKNGYKGNREFLIEVLMLSLLSHPNLVNLLGYCADGDERILVYDYMQHGSLQDHLTGLRPDSKPLDWNTRMKIAAGAAKGLEHLHDTANPPVIYRNLKSSNILLDNDFNPRLTDFGLSKLGPAETKNHVSTRVMGTFGYCAPEYALTGKLTKMSDIYSFGVVLLELITGRKAMDTTRPRNEQILVEWAAPLFKDKRNLIKITDPLLEGKFPVKALYQAVAISSMCLQEEDNIRPLIKDIVCTLQFLAMPEGNSPSSEGPKHSVIENQIPPEPQLHESPKEKGTSDSSEEELRQSSVSDWQSCSTSRGDIEELREGDAT